MQLYYILCNYIYMIMLLDLHIMFYNLLLIILVIPMILEFVFMKIFFIYICVMRVCRVYV